MAKFDLYEKPTWPKTVLRASSHSPVQFVAGVSLWFLMVFVVGYFILAL